MLGFMCDPYHPYDTLLTRQTFELFIEFDLAFCALSKGGTRAFRDIDLFPPSRDAYAATLTSLDDDFGRKWERNAPLPSDRIAAMRRFHQRGIFTWVSLEPTLSVEASLAIGRGTHGFVDLYKVGKANYLGALSKNIDWREYTLRIIDLMHQLGAKHYIKRDLQEYLPEGYHNPLRVPQHH